MSTIAIIGASGKVGGATLQSLLQYTSQPASSIIALTTSGLSSLGVAVRQASFDDPASLEAGLRGVDKFFLVSSPKLQLDFYDAPEGQGWEKQHIAAIDAARKAGVEQVYYTSLAFGDNSPAAVMNAHLRTEKYLKSLEDIKWTIIREGLYNESWPLYLGYFNAAGDDRTVIKIGGDGKVSFTSIDDLGIANALVLADDSDKWAGKIFYLSTPAAMAKSAQEIKELVSAKTGHQLELEIVGRKEHERYYIEERGMPEQDVKWWSGTFSAMENGETEVDDPTLTELLARVGKKPTPIEETIKVDKVRMVSSSRT